MRILVLAQSNGAVLNIERAIKKVSPDVIIHLGCGLKDFSKIRTDIPVYFSKGPHDFFVRAPKVAKILLEKVPTIYTYGKHFETNKGLGKLTQFAKDEKTKLVLYAYGESGYFERQGIVFVNPGEINKKQHKFAVIDINNQDIVVHHESVNF